MTVEIGDITFEYIEPGEDKDADAALRLALSYKEHGPYVIKGAIVHHTDGLVLLDDMPEMAARGHHLQTPLCGFDGSGPQVSSIILELFGFGQGSNVYPTLRTQQLCFFRRA